MGDLRQLSLELAPLPILAGERRLHEVPTMRLLQCLLNVGLSTHGDMDALMLRCYEHFADQQQREPLKCGALDENKRKKRSSSRSLHSQDDPKKPVKRKRIL